MSETVNPKGLADFTVLASTSEGMSTTSVESMACGRPVVASAIPGSRELITDGVDGLLFPVGDTEAFAARILDATEPRLRGRMGAAARRKVERDYALAPAKQRQLELIDRLL